ncbi:helix-turn-helix transcriptional regulator [Streptomyces sp. NPDC006463]|uniref:helix-turn-helix transcriptional regulator n=1 Tax=Streptomyces sp. NPDC006463 TaxID=3364746 RepID=UPI003673F49E
MVKATRVTNTIRAQRFAHGEMTQAELARRIGVSRQTVIAIEQGRYSPSLEMAFQIAQVFGVPLDSVFQYSAAPTGSSDSGSAGGGTGTGTEGETA